MASIKNTYICPRCEVPLTSDQRPNRCPECDYDFKGKDEIVGYKPPLTFSEQRERLKNEMDYYDALLSISMDKANSMMNDALNIIETLPGKNVLVSDIRELVQMAIRIGKVAEKYHEFLSEGGKHTPSLFIKPKKEEVSNEPNKTGNGEVSTGGFPAPM